MALTSHLIDAFEVNDQRAIKWTDAITADGITYYFPTKYKNGTVPDYSEYVMIFRLAEQYLYPRRSIRSTGYAGRMQG